MDDSYRDLFTRWFQLGAFCPMFRVHGSGFPKELWAFGPETESRLVKVDKLRYRLMPYLYSVAWQVSHNGYTMMRPLVMDFRDDAAALNIPDQFMFGPALMVNPVTRPGQSSRSVYFPGNTPWTDFETGKVYPSAGAVDVPAPIETIPLMVRAGSIIPLGPEVQSTADPCDPIELRVYRGADGSFDLYEDDGLTNQYQGGAYSIIPIRWNENSQILTIGKRQGTFPGMMPAHTFRIVLVSPTHGLGGDVTENADQQVQYTGAETSFKPGK
jgi:alpha-D-xyloside xylohydrolase